MYNVHTIAPHHTRAHDEVITIMCELSVRVSDLHHPAVAAVRLRHLLCVHHAALYVGT